ncbi:MAG: aminotransferase class IV family protein [Planctomycetes bacterium]|nr:aminotransferase class IV family protein [Planctomycetota bacterium]
MQRDSIWVCGRWVDARAAAISAEDAGFRAGVGLFETLRVRAGEPRRLAAHLARLRASAAELGLPGPPAERIVRRVAAALARRNRRANGALRLVVTPGADAGPTCVIELRELPDGMAEAAECGAAAVVWPGARGDDPVARHKTLSRLPLLVAQHWAGARGAWEALWCDAPAGKGAGARAAGGGRRVLEGCATNLFVIQGKRLITAPTRAPILPGIARAVVLAAAAAAGLRVTERAPRLEELRAADEAFLTNGLRGVVPLVRVDGRAIADGRPGSATGRLRELLEAR